MHLVRFVTKYSPDVTEYMQDIVQGVRLQGRDRYHSNECFALCTWEILCINGIPGCFNLTEAICLIIVGKRSGQRSNFKLPVSLLVRGVLTRGKKFSL